MRLLALLTLCLPVWANWGNGYKYRTTATIASGQVTGTLSNFPALLSLSDTQLKTVGNGGGVQNTCTQSGSSYNATIPADFLITSDSAGSTQITGVEFEQYSASAGTALVWVNVASAAVGTEIYIFYGNGSVTTCRGTVSNTWNSNYANVYHLPNGSTLNANDSTINASNGAATGATASSSGEVDGAGSFSGSSQYIDVGYGSLGTTSAFTLSAWVNITAFPSNSIGSILISGFNGTQIPFGMDIDNTSGVTYVRAISLWSGGTVAYWNISGTTWNTGTWHYVVVTYGSGELTTYFDGVQKQQTGITGGAIPTSAYHTGIGGLSSSGTWANFLDGTVDEVRLVSTVLSTAWMAADINTQSAPNTFWTLSYDGTNGGPCTMALLGAGAC